VAALQTIPTPVRPAHAALPAWLGQFEHLHLDLGTGDGAYALHLARTDPARAVVGVDTCLDNLAKPARRGQDNLRFLAADATDIPVWLWERADAVTINFPYGKLLRAVAGREPWPLLATTGAALAIRVNESAAVAEDIPFDDVVVGVRRTLGGRRAQLTVLPGTELRSFPSTWAKRLAHGRPTRMLVATANRR
jgi:SAM-dependent methyltransferase